MRLLSVNVSPVRSVDGGKPTGIYKEPVASAWLSPLGLEGDGQANRRYHGGPDQAVYLYSQADYRWWEEQLGRALPPGTFGENLTLDELPEPVRLGDRLRVGSVLLEVTAPRVACSTLAQRLGDPKFVKRFSQADRPGYYARVLEPGRLEPGPATWLPGAHISGLEVYRMLLGKPTPEQLRRALESPLSERLRAAFSS